MNIECYLFGNYQKPQYFKYEKKFNKKVKENEFKVVSLWHFNKEDEEKAYAMWFENGSNIYTDEPIMGHITISPRTYNLFEIYNLDVFPTTISFIGRSNIIKIAVSK